MTDEDAVVDRRRFVGRLAAAGGVAAGATVGSSVLFPTAASAATDIDLTNTARVKNALDAANDQDYVTKKQVKNGNPIIVAASGQPAEVQAAALLSGGGVCDGTNDQVEIQAALLAGSTSGRAVMLSAGTFNVDTVSHVNWPGAYTALYMYNGSRLLGRGSSATTIRLINNATHNTANNNAYMITNQFPNTTGNTDILVGDLTVDGNAAGQTGLNKCFHGIAFWRTNRTQCERVVVQNMRGLTSVDQNETFAFDVLLGANASFIECRATRVTGSTASGFSVNYGTAVRYYGCVAENMTVGMGFTSYMATQLSYANCLSRNNGNVGFNWEFCDNVSFSGCHAGGLASSSAGGVPYANNQSFGNTQHGFRGAGNGTQGFRAELVGCTSTRNGGNGLMLDNTRDVRVVGGAFTNNDKGVVVFPDTAARSTRLEGVAVSANTTAQYDVPGNYAAAFGTLPIPAMPASNVAYYHNLPFDAVVYLNGGTFSTVKLTDRNGVVTDLGAQRTVVVAPGCGITITYTAAPTWKWMGGG